MDRKNYGDSVYRLTDDGASVQVPDTSDDDDDDIDDEQHQLEVFNIIHIIS